MINETVLTLPQLHMYETFIRIEECAPGTDDARGYFALQIFRSLIKHN